MLRPLPPAIAAMALLLVVKGVALVRPGGTGDEPSALALAGAAMVPAARASSSPAGATAPKAAPGAASGQAPGHAPSGHTPVAAKAAAPPAGDADGAAGGPRRPSTPSKDAAAAAEPAVGEAERAVLLDLRARREALDARERALAAREAVLAAAEKRLAARVQEMADLQARLEALETARRDRGEANWRGLVRTYESMRPRDAAAILTEMEMPVLVEVLDRMKEAKAAPVLAAMPAERARTATTQLALMRTRANTPADPGAGPTLAGPLPAGAAAPPAPGR